METLKFILTSTFYPPYHLGGDAVHVKHLADALASRGHEVHVLHSLDAYRLKRKEMPKARKEDDGVNIHTLRHPFGKIGPMWTYLTGRSRYVEKKYQELLGQVKPDVVHHHNISLLGHGLFRKMGDYRQIYTAHDHWLVCPKNDFIYKGSVCSSKKCVSCSLQGGRPPQLWREKMMLDGLDGIISPSNYLASHLGKLGISIEVLHNFIPNPPATIQSSGDEGFFLFLGVLEPHKGVLHLLNAVTNSKNRLYIGGRGSLEGWILQTIEKKKLSSRIKYLKWVDDKWGYLHDAAAIVIPSIYPENCPMVALEALSVGTPVICSDAGGTKEIVEKISPELVIPTLELEMRLSKMVPPKIPREKIKKVFDDNFSEKVYMEKYMKILKEGCQSIS